MVSLLFCLQAPAANHDWPAYLGDAARSHFSLLKQIDPGNVERLEMAWTYHSGDARTDNLSQIQCNPLIIDGVLYGTTPQLRLVALHAATGRELWKFDPFAGNVNDRPGGVNRGLAWWTDGNERRILFSVDHFLFAIDPAMGRPFESFGTGGRVDIKEGLGRDVSNLFVASTTPGVVYGYLLYLPVRVGEGPAPAAPGHIKAYDVRTGKIVWTFHTIPHPGEEGADTWPPDAWTYIGGANCWAGMAVDERRGILFVPTGSAAFDFWGGNRIGQNFYANCLLALDANTGRRLWHFQFVHHDLWDRDPPATPNLLTLTRDGRKSMPSRKSPRPVTFTCSTVKRGNRCFPSKNARFRPRTSRGRRLGPRSPCP